MGWTLLGGLLPGAAWWARAGWRQGRRLGLAAGAVVVVVGLLFGDLTSLVTSVGAAIAEWVAISPQRLLWAAGLSVSVAVVWALLVVLTHRAARRDTDLVQGQRVACAVLVVALIVVGGVPAVKVASYALVTRQTLISVFGQGTAQAMPGASQPKSGQADPWADLPRVNVLLIGSDAGADRTGIRPDTMIVASINTRTGDTVLFSLPRNLQRVPFPPGSPAAAAYPHGFYCRDPACGVNTECLLNGLWTFGQGHAGDYYAGARDPGLTATIQGAEQVTGLEINNYVMINLRGFMEFVDAIGGLTLTLRERLPVGGNVEDRGGTTSWLNPGRHKLDGYHALWYARSRWSTNDYDRMRRQRCVIGAVTQQADPVTVARNFPAIARAAQRNIQTDIGLNQLDAWVQLTKRVQHASVRSLPFTDQVIDTVHPDFDQVHELVQRSLTPPATTRHGSGASATRTSPATTPKTRPEGTGRATTPVAEDVRDVC